MCKNIIYIFLCLSIVSCSKENPKQFKNNGYVLQIEFSKSYSTIVYLSEFTQSGLKTVDSTSIENNFATFRGQVANPSRYLISTTHDSGRKVLIIANDSIQLKINDSELSDGIISGSEINDTMIAHQKKIRRTYKKVDALFPDIQRARLANNVSALQSISNKITKIEQEVLEINFSFVKTNQNSFISAMILNDLSKRDSIDIDKISQLYQNLSPTVKKGKDAIELESTLNAISNH
ncbi:DUF4369 domain-containing protein [Urechidicola vernalis]|uniref:DUF4369 domain-containing protein n=1 Tax=Urechidicola vernalis TaxID=3075600 RepID=A0ABU2Y1U7_9FLAO|nr:DUF4369 domain-containing protein [Urechidicola sp. P050]MDT0552157.1 DUF4369 domain-containing protein [Urechidicola sp. P050]